MSITPNTPPIQRHNTTNPSSLHLQENTLTESVNSWCQNNGNTQPYRDAKNIILEFLQSPNSSVLNLSYLAINNLPENFNPPSLRVLELSGTQITSFPDDFNPPALEELNLTNSQITCLPDKFNPPALKRLTLYYTQITQLPDNFNPPALKSLGLSNTQITHFPYDFNPLTLEYLDVSRTSMENLPDNFNPPALIELRLDNTPIASLPDNFNPPFLTHLKLVNSQITCLPDNFNPPALIELDLEGTQISSFPETLFTLPHTCTISLSMANFSEYVRENLQERTEDPSYHGPRFRYDMRSTQPESYSHTTLEEAFDMVIKRTEIKGIDKEALSIPLVEGTSNSDKENLKIWLCRLFETASATSERNKFYFRSVIETIKEAASNSEIKAIFYVVLQTACTTCGDRVALSALHFDIQRKLAQLDISKPSDTYNFLINCVFIMDKLEKFAVNTVPTLPLTDPLEVFLGLPVRLKEEYRIPINTENMLFFGLSGLRDDHLDQARADLDADLKNEDVLLSFLIEQPKWLEVLSFVYPSEVSTLKEKRDEDAADPETSASALEDYNKGLKSLSKKARRIGRASRRIRA